MLKVDSLHRRIHKIFALEHTLYSWIACLLKKILDISHEGTQENKWIPSFKMIKCPFSNFSATTAFKIRDTVICWKPQAERGRSVREDLATDPDAAHSPFLGGEINDGHF